MWLTLRLQWCQKAVHSLILAVNSLTTAAVIKGLLFSKKIRLWLEGINGLKFILTCARGNSTNNLLLL